MTIKGKMIFIMLVLLQGCTHHNENFDCPVGVGLGCQSVTEVKKKLNQGEIESPETTMEAYQRRENGYVSSLAPMIMKKPVSGDVSSLSFGDSSGMVIQRTPEKPMRVWIAPYQDPNGNFHEASVIHTVVQGGAWKISPETAS